MSWVMVGVAVVSVVGSVVGNVEQQKAQKKQNEAIRTMANAQAKLKRSYLEQSKDIKVHDLLAMTLDVDNAVGLELTNLLYNSEQTKGEIKTSLADRNIYGTSASKIDAVAGIKQELSADMVQGKMEQQYKSIATELDSVKLDYEREALAIQLGLANALSQQNTHFKSGLSMGLEGVQAGIGGASTGMNLRGSLGSGGSGSGGVNSGVGSVNKSGLESSALKSYDTGNNWWGGK